jgi:hypothetical protein
VIFNSLSRAIILDNLREFREVSVHQPPCINRSVSVMCKADLFSRTCATLRADRVCACVRACVCNTIIVTAIKEKIKKEQIQGNRYRRVNQALTASCDSNFILNYNNIII